jgi:hypothetical protein
LDDGEVIRGKLVVTRRDTTTLLDPVKTVKEVDDQMLIA